MDPDPIRQPDSKNQPLSLPTENGELESIKDALGSISLVIKMGMAVLMIAFFFSGIKFLEQYEKGILIRFGKVKGIKENPGLVFALPYPIDRLIKVPAKRTQSLASTTFWYKLSDTEQKTGITDKVPRTLKPGIDGYLITADRNIVHAKCSLKYRINNPISYALQSTNIKMLIQRYLDNVMVKATGRITIDDALKNKNKFAQEVTSLLAQQLQKMTIGVDIDPVDIQLSWPRQLANDINEVIRAKQKYAQDTSSAKVYARGQKDLADSQAQNIKFEANTWATQRLSRTKADAATFKKIFPLYKKNPDVIKQTLYQDRMKKIMANIDEIFIIEQSDNREIRINLQRKQKKTTDADKS